MQKGKNEIVVEYIENTLNASSLYTDRIYRWMNKEGRDLFDMESVEKEFFKQGRISLKEEKEDAEFEFEVDFEEESSHFHKKLLIPASEHKDMILSACEKEKQQKKKDCCFEKRLNWLGKILGLNACEFSILRLYAYIRRSHILSAFLSDIFPCQGYRHDFYIYDHPEVLGETEEHIAKAIGSKGRLCRSGIISLGGKEHGLANPIYEMLKMPIKSSDEMKQILIGQRLDGNIPLDEFQFLGQIPDHLKRLLKNAIRTKQKGVNILLYGSPGTGKTEFAKSLSRAVGENLYSVCDGENSQSEPTREDRLSSLKMADYILSRSKGILLLDEAEDLFDTGFMSENQGSKVFMNRFLENNAHPIIWTTNNIFCMDSAYIRRFTYMVPFKKPDERVRKNIWQKTVAENGLALTNDDVQSLAEGYNVPPAIITSAVKSAKMINGGVPELKDALSMYAKAMGTDFTVKQTKSNIVFNPALLNTDIDMEKLANRLCQSKARQFSLCLYGAPGTGKSAYARYIAEKMNMEVVEKKASDLFGPHVGETERNIATAFAMAREKKAMLIFDEADSFLQDRNLATRSWEMTQVNEMLTQMESYPFPFVCTTNLMDKLDKASLRRFTFKVKYDYLTPEQVVKSFMHFFGQEIGAKEVQDLTCLTPGDFVVVKKKADILGCLNDSGELIGMLSNEMAVKGEKLVPLKIGFV